MRALDKHDYAFIEVLAGMDPTIAGWARASMQYHDMTRADVRERFTEFSRIMAHDDTLARVHADAEPTTHGGII